MDQYITLISNASMDLFPDNKLSSFRTRLPYVHDFSIGKWAVALTEITYTKSWFNIGPGHHVTPAFMNDGAVVSSMKSAFKTKIQPGYYAKPHDLVDHINDVISKWKKTKDITRLPKYEVKSNQKLGIQANKTFRRMLTETLPVYSIKNWQIHWVSARIGLYIWTRE